LFYSRSCAVSSTKQNLLPQIELEVVNSFEEVCIFSPPRAAVESNVVSQDVWNRNNNSTRWVILQPQIKCDLITLDNQLDNEYADHLMQGKSLPINFSSFVHMVQAIGYTDRPSKSLNRSFTRLKTVFCTFYKIPYVFSCTQDSLGKITGVAENLDVPANHLPFREFNFFYHPQYVYPGDTHLPPFKPISKTWLDNGYWSHQWKTEPELQLQIGSKLFPEIPMRSSTEMYYQLRKALGSHQPGSQYAINVLKRLSQHTLYCSV